MQDRRKRSVCGATCEHCNGPGGTGGDRCCWGTAMQILKFQEKVKHKYILEVILDLLISTASVSTDIIALCMYLYKDKLTFALLTAIPVLLPTFVFTNVYLADESSTTRKEPTASRTVSVISGNGKNRRNSLDTFKEEPDDDKNGRVESASSFDTLSTDSSIHPIDDRRRYQQACLFHWPCFRAIFAFWGTCCSGCWQCFCNRDSTLRRRGAIAVKNSFQRLFKYAFGTIVLRFIAWAWYVKALIFGVKAYREPKKFMHIAPPDTHWSYELLVRLDFLQAALENAPQCVVQLYALITQSDEDVALGLLTLILSFIDFIRVAVSVHWDMDKGPVTAPSGCYRTLFWKLLNTSSWILIYSARSSAIALVIATSMIPDSANPGGSRVRLKILFPILVFTFHCILFGKLLHKVEYGTAAQKIVVTVFISIFFLPELDSSIMPHTIQFYYATIIIQNTFFIMPWEGFDQEYCISSAGMIEKPPKPKPPSLVLPPGTNATAHSTRRSIFRGAFTAIPTNEYQQEYLATTIAGEVPATDHGCLIDPVWISLAVPTMTIFGVIFRLVSSQKMHRYKSLLPEDNMEKQRTQRDLEASITKIFNRNWTQMTAREMIQAFLRMLKKEVIIIEKGESIQDEEGLGNALGGNSNKRVSFLAARLQADFLASQTFIRESFSLMTRTTRSHDVYFGRRGEGEDESPPEYNSDSELTFKRSNCKKRPRLPRSRNVSETVDEPAPTTTHVQVDTPSGPQILEMCWI